MRDNRKISWRRKAIALVAAAHVMGGQASPLFALPQGERVTGGEVTFSRQGDNMTIQQTSHKAIVNYDSFSIGSPETVHFIQPDSSSAILNRVTGDQSSVLAGVLLANGNVYLINPNGILFTSSARINVSSLFASALDITDDDFFAGRLLFTGSGGSVVNQGEITAADRVCLFGSVVDNSGVIRAGNVFMAAASTSIEIDNAAGGAIRLLVDGQPLDKDSTTGSSTQPPADQPDQAPAAGSPGETGTTPPQDQPDLSDQPDQPAAGMVINQGTVSVSSDIGGTVTMSGNRVGQFGVVNADGTTGNGGRITISAADTIALGEASLTTANAGSAGNGGAVIAFSPESALFRGGAVIEARGGSESGDGGFVEVSGRQHVEIFGTVNASARNGQAGTFLIDPSNVTLANSPPGDGTWIPAGGPPYAQFNPNTDTAVADIGTLLSSLQNNNVIVTTANGAGTQLGNITVADPINLDGTGGQILTLQAHNNILINANITDLTPATPDNTDISLVAGNDITIGALIDTGGGTLNINADGNVAVNGNIVTDGGSFVSGGVNFTSSAGATITTGGGDVDMLGHSGAISINDTIDTTGGAGEIRIYGSSITLNQNINPVVLNSGGTVLLRTATIAINGDVVGPSVTVADTSGIGIGLGATTVPGGLHVSATELEHITTPALELDTAGRIMVDNIAALDSQNADLVTLDAGGNISFANNAATFQALVAQADNGITVNANVSTIAGNLSLDGDADNATDGTDNILFADSVMLDAAGSLSLDATGGGMSAAGVLALVAGNGVSLNNSLSGPPAAGMLLISADADTDGAGTATVAAGAAINEFSGQILISANDLNLLGTLSAGTILIAESHGGGIGLGDTAAGLSLGGSTLQRVGASSLTLATPGSITVDNITAGDSQNSGDVILSAGGSMAFDNSPSTFNSLAAQANDGISVNADVLTDTGDMSLDGDYDNTPGVNDNIWFADGVQLSSEGSLSLEASSGGMTGAGALTLMANNGIAVRNNLVTAGLTTVNADADSTGGGTLAISAGATINTAANTIDLTANDIDLAGNIQAGLVYIRGSDGTGIGLGGTTVAGGLNVAGAELQRITATALELVTAGSVTVNGISAANSQNADSVTIDAGGTVLFDTGASTFDSLTVRADNGITVNRNLTSVVGNIVLDGDADNGTDGSDMISYAEGVLVSSAGSITLDATTGGIQANGSGLTLSANNGIAINDDLTLVPTPLSGVLLMDADADNNGTGMFTVRPGVSVIGLTGEIRITADDVDLQGSLVGNPIYISESAGHGIGIGSSPVAGGLNLAAAELRNITSSSLSLDTAGSMIVDNISALDSESANSVTLVASGSVTFDNNPSTFDSLAVRADDGINVNRGITTDSGSLSLDGDADNAVDGIDYIWFGNVQIDSAGSLILKATTGGMNMDGLLMLNANNGIALNSNLTGPPMPMAAILAANADADGNGSGTFSLAAGTTTDLLAGQAWITANDIDIQGSMLAGAVNVLDSDGTGIGLGATAIAAGLNIDGSELQRITTSALQLSTDGSITVDGVSAANSQNAASVALVSGGTASFNSNPSTFNVLNVRADDGVAVNQNLTTDTGDMAIDGDANNAVNGNDAIRFASGVQLTSAGSLTLKATTGDMTGAGALTLVADNGISVLDSLTTAGLTTIDADANAAGGGDLAVSAGATIDTVGNILNVTANDVDLQGSMMGSAVNIYDSDGTGIGLGGTAIAGGLNFDGNELQRITTSAIQLSTGGPITVDGVSAANSQNAASVALVSGGTASFNSNPSTFNALSVRADNGVAVNQNLTTDSGDMAIDGDANNAVNGNDAIRFASGVQLTSAGSLTLKATTGDMTGAGTLTLVADNGISLLDSLITAGLTTIDADANAAGGGDLAVAAGATIDTVGNILNVTANDVDLQGSMMGSAVNIYDPDGTGIGLGATALAGGLNLAGAELQRITTAALQLSTGGPITVDGVSAANSQNAASVTLVSGGTASFNSNPSTFNALSVRADNGVTINQNLTTDTGDMAIDGDANNAANGNDAIRFASGVQLTSAGSLTLKATTGDMTGAGTLTLVANSGISLLDSLTTAGLTTIDADANAAGGGDLAVAAGAAIDTTGNILNVTANDVDLQGSMMGSAVNIYDSDGTGIGLGGTAIASGLNLAGAELQRITTAALQISTAGPITVDGVSAANSQNAASVVLVSGGTASFNSNPSTFNSLNVRADNGVAINQNLTTDTGDMAIDGDANNAANGNDAIHFAGGVQLTSAGSLTLKATTGDMTGADTLTLVANSGISLLDSLTTAGLTTIDADANAAGGGDLAVAAGAAIDTTGNILNVTANDVDLQGSMMGSAVNIYDSDGTGIGLGGTAIASGLNLAGAELQRITTAALQLSTGGPITVDGVSAANSQNAASVALVSGGIVSFNSNPSTFNALNVRADNGVAVNQNLTTDTGDMAIDGDANNAANGNDAIRFASGVELTSAGSLTLKATTGDMTGDGTLTLNANTGIAIFDNLTVAGSLAVNDDTTVAGGVVIRAGSHMTVSDGSHVRGAGALGMSAGDNMTLGGDVTSAGAMDLLADSNGDGTGLLLIKGDVSTDGAIPDGTITLTGEIQVNGSMTVGSPDLSLSGADRNDVDYAIMAPITAGGIIIRMGHSISDGTADESGLLLAPNVNLTARTGSIGVSGGSEDIDIIASILRASAGGNIYIEEADSVRVLGGVRGGGSVGLNIHGNLTGDSVGAGNRLVISAGGINCSTLSAGASANVTARGGITAGSVSAGGDLVVSAGAGISCNSLAAGGTMDLDGASLEFDTLTAYSVDGDIAGGIAMGRATLADLADFVAGGTISDHDSMITARDIYLIAGGNIGGSAIELNVDRISLIKAGGLVHIVQHAPGQTPLGLISAGDHFDVEVPNGGFSDGNGAGLNFKAVNNSYLAIHGTCGEICSPLQIEIDPGHLHVNGINISGADTPDGSVWISLERVLGRDPVTGNQIDYIGDVEIPGLVLFNGAAAIGDAEVFSSIWRTEAFSLETPELRSRQGVFGSPYFVHAYMNITEPIALGLVDYLLHGLAYVSADPEFPSIAKQKITMWQKGFLW